MTRTVVVTGASHGLGAAAARALTKQGNEVVVVGRSPARTEAVARELGAEYLTADFSELSQVRELSVRLLDGYSHIDVLINNAGALNGSRLDTVDGFEATLQTNYLAPFLLTGLLRNRLAQSRAVVINTASSLHRYSPALRLDDLNFVKGYRPSSTYRASKLEVILFTRELQRRYRDQHISTASFNPGIIDSGFGSRTGVMTRIMYRPPFTRFMATTEQGADTAVWLASNPPGELWRSGGYYDRRRPGHLSAQARDDRLAAGLWDRSCELVGLDW